MIAIAQRIFAASLMLVLLSTVLPAQGLYWETIATGLVTDTSQTYYMPGMMKNVSADEISILRLDKHMIYEVYPSRKQYTETTFAELEAMQKNSNTKMQASMEEMKKYLENLPAEQRKQMEGMMGKQMSKGGDMNVEVKNTGDRKKISGYDCVKSVMIVNGQNFMNVWTTRDVPGYAGMQKDYIALSERMMSQNSGQGKQMAEAMKKMDGFMIQMEMGNDMKMTVTKVEKRSVSRNEFEIPAGYKKVKIAGPNTRNDNPMEYQDSDDTSSDTQ